MMQQVPKNFKPVPYAYHWELELCITDLNHLGHGVGRDGNWVVFVPFALPGERVKARIFRNHAQHSEADLMEVLEASKLRVTPVCPLFGSCGGCQYQHLSYAGQLAHKHQELCRIFREFSGFAGLEPLAIRPCERPYGYRSKLTPAYPSRLKESSPIGFLRAGQRRNLVDVPSCSLGTGGINAALPAARADLRKRKAGSKRGGTLLLRECTEGVVTDASAMVSTRLKGKFFQHRAGGFFQNNLFLLPELVDYVIAQASMDGARVLVDAYCGSGLFAICAAADFQQVFGIEVSADAVAQAQGNAAANHVRNASFFIGNSEEIFASLGGLRGAEVALVLDPPRAGCSEAFLKQLLDFKPQRVVYVSCNPTSQARDLKHLSGLYQLLEVQAFDMFPQTRHLENVCTLSL